MKSLIAIAAILMSAAAFAQDSDWNSSVTKDIAGVLTNTAITSGDSDGTNLIVRGGHDVQSQEAGLSRSRWRLNVKPRGTFEDPLLQFSPLFSTGVSF